MPAKSKAQQKAAGAALSAKRGDTEVGELKGASKSMYKSMSEKELDDMASTKRKGKPEHTWKAEAFKDGLKKSGDVKTQCHAGPDRASKTRPSGTKGSQLQKRARP